MASVFSIDELNALDMLRQKSLVNIKQRIEQLSRTSIFEELPAEDAKELQIAKLAFDITSPTDSEIARAARDAIMARRQAGWNKARTTH